MKFFKAPPKSIALVPGNTLVNRGGRGQGPLVHCWDGLSPPQLFSGSVTFLMSTELSLLAIVRHKDHDQGQ